MIRLHWLMYFFMQGLILANTACLFTCATPVLAVLAGTQDGPNLRWSQFFKFSLGRILGYLLFGMSFLFIGFWLLQLFQTSIWGSAARRILGLLLLLSGCNILFNKKLCHCPQRHLSNLFIWGFLVGLSPCLPMLSMFAQMAIVGPSIWEMFVYTLSFAVATVFSPILIVFLLGSKGAVLLKKINSAIGTNLSAGLLVLWGLVLLV